MSRKKLITLGVILVVGVLAVFAFKRMERISDTKNLTPEEYQLKYSD